MDPFVFTYEDSMQREVQNKRKVLIEDVDLPQISDEKEGADDNVLRNTARMGKPEREQKWCP